jgi:hypothetical protein
LNQRSRTVKGAWIVGFIAVAANVSIITPARASIPAFPGAEGAGAYSIGGRDANFTLYQVTTLNDNGPGSLREACEAAGPRVVVFRVAGYITLSNAIEINHPYLTIAGQTAPGGGVCLRMADTWPPREGAMVAISTHDVIVRYLRFRPGPGNLQGKGNVGGNALVAKDIFNDVYNLIVDHCSLSWGNDQIGPDAWASKESTSATIREVSFQHNLIAEGLQDHSCGSLFGSNRGKLTDVDYHHNLSMSSNNRHPLAGDTTATRIVSNLAYNWSRFGFGIQKGGRSSTGVANVDWINNKAKGGPNTEAGCVCYGNHMDYYLTADHLGPGYYSAYLSGNIGYGQTSPPVDQWSLTSHAKGADFMSPAPAGYQRSPWEPLAGKHVPITQTAAVDLEGTILPDVGACWRLDERGNPWWVRDSADAMFVYEYVTNTGHFTSWKDVLPWPILAAGTPYPDADCDGMGDAWERAKFGSLKRNGKGDFDNDGYLDIEEFLNVTDPRYNDFTSTRAFLYASAFTNHITSSSVAGTIAQVQASDNDYLVLQTDADSPRVAGKFTLHYPENLAKVSKLILQIELKTSRARTGLVGLQVFNHTSSRYEEVRPGELWQGGDAWMTWETTDLGTYLADKGELSIIVGSTTASSDEDPWAIALDTVRAELYHPIP